MFVKGAGWQKKIFGASIMYGALLSLALLYGAAIFHAPGLENDGIILLLSGLALLVLWIKFKNKTDPQFAARTEAYKINRPADLQSDKKNAPLLIATYHLVFLALALVFRSDLQSFGKLPLSWEHAALLATMLASALAAAAVMALLSITEQRRKARGPASETGQPAADAREN